jgi:hypothetical protein
VINRSIGTAEFGRNYGNCSAKTAKQIIEREIPFTRINGRVLVKQSDAEAWREAHTQTPESPSLKSLLRQISEKVLEKRKGAEDKAAPGKESRGTEQPQPSTP